MFGQVVSSEEAVKAQHPGVLHRLGEEPHVRGAPDVVVTVNEQRIPLHKPLEVHMVNSWQRGLQQVDDITGGKGQESWQKLTCERKNLCTGK